MGGALAATSPLVTGILAGSVRVDGVCEASLAALLALLSSVPPQPPAYLTLRLPPTGIGVAFHREGIGVVLTDE